MDDLEKAFMVALDSARDLTVEGAISLIKTCQSPDGSIAAPMVQRLIASLESLKNLTPNETATTP